MLYKTLPILTICVGGLVAVILVFVVLLCPALALKLVETPFHIDDVISGKLPKISERIPVRPSIVVFNKDRKIGRQGGQLRTLVGRPKDLRLLVVYGYARLVGYDENFELKPDILESFSVDEGRRFTFRIREGHRWSDGDPLDADDFRYWWVDVANNQELSPAGPPRVMLVNGEEPEFEVLNRYTVRYTWKHPNPYFLSRLAGASPLFIYRPSHYLMKFHQKYADAAKLTKMLKIKRLRNWASLHNRSDNMYRFDNPELPTLQPWVNKTRPPATRFVAIRNPYYHRIDEAGRQLPYLDRVVMIVSDGKMIAAKAGTGEVDLQARNLSFSHFTFLHENEKMGGFKTLLWRNAKGSHIALFPNLNARDKGMRNLLRNVMFRRALSLATDRALINETLYFGLALESNNTVLPESPLYKEDYQYRWAEYDPDMANDFLDKIGLDKIDKNGFRLLPDGRPLEIIVETAGEDIEQTDILELVKEAWAEVGLKMFIKPSQRQVFRNRVFSGAAHMSVWGGVENGVPTVNSSPEEFAPTSQQQLMWPMWGQYFETSGNAGEAPDLDSAIELTLLNERWRNSIEEKERETLWRRILEIHTDQVFSIGLISGVQQPIVVKEYIRNVPKEGIYNWDPGAHFGIYRPDTFWRESE